MHERLACAFSHVYKTQGICNAQALINWTRPGYLENL